MSYMSLITKNTRSQLSKLSWEVDGSLSAHTYYDESPSLQYAKTMADMKKPDHPVFGRHARVIPPHVLAASFREGWFSDDDKWRRWSNDESYKRFWVWDGRV